MMNGLYIADNRRRVYVCADENEREEQNIYTVWFELQATCTYIHTHRIVLLRRSLFLSRVYVRMCITIEREHH